MTPPKPLNRRRRPSRRKQPKRRPQEPTGAQSNPLQGTSTRQPKRVVYLRFRVWGACRCGGAVEYHRYHPGRAYAECSLCRESTNLTEDQLIDVLNNHDWSE